MDRTGKIRLKALALTYPKYLLSPHWRQFRKDYLKNHPRVCLVCPSRRVQFHHLTYERLGHERASDVVLLCPKHHRATHNHQKAIRRRFLTPEAIQAALTRKHPTTPPRARRRP
jgi:hypothetical protein